MRSMRAQVLAHDTPTPHHTHTTPQPQPHHTHLSKLVSIIELDLGNGGTPPRVVDNILHDTLGVSMPLSVVKHTKLHSSFASAHVGPENTSFTLPLTRYDFTHVFLLPAEGYCVSLWLSGLTGRIFVRACEANFGEGAFRWWRSFGHTATHSTQRYWDVIP